MFSDEEFGPSDDTLQKDTFLHWMKIEYLQYHPKFITRILIINLSMIS